MAIFLLIYAVVYGGMNAYAFSKPYLAFDLGRGGMLGLGALWVLMVGGPILFRIMERAGMDLMLA